MTSLPALEAHCALTFAGWTEGPPRDWQTGKVDWPKADEKVAA